MKLSADPKSRNFYHHVLGEGNLVDVYINGAQIFSVFEADDAEDYAVVYVVEHGKIVVDPATGNPVMKRIHGKVEFRKQK